MRRKFGSKRDENGEGRRLYNEELNGLYRLPSVGRFITSRRLRCWDVGRMEKSRSPFKILTSKPAGMKS